MVAARGIKIHLLKEHQVGILGGDKVDRILDIAARGVRRIGARFAAAVHEKRIIFTVRAEAHVPARYFECMPLGQLALRALGDLKRLMILDPAVIQKNVGHINAHRQHHNQQHDQQNRQQFFHLPIAPPSADLQQHRVLFVHFHHQQSLLFQRLHHI